MTNENRRIYTAQTKQDAVGQVMRAGLLLGQVARAFEMPIQTLENWVRSARRCQEWLLR
ncbi:MAG: transposase [Cytophagales bacterium]|nr:transposase [Cytophagales bacterium]